MKLSSGLTVLLIVLVGSGHAADVGESLSLVDLIHPMTDLERLAVLPAPGEQGAMWASTDRASQYDAATDKYVHWDTNDDGGGFIRKEGKQIVMAEMQGPGVIWRIWSAQANAGHVKIYLDGAPEPAVDLPFQDYFDARREPFNYPALSYDAAKGKNVYFPIPYQKSCKVVADPGWGRYYHFTHATLPQGTRVPTFSTKLTPQEIEALKGVNDYFTSRLGADPAGPRHGQQSVGKTITAAAGQTLEVAKLAGPRAITALRVKMSFKDREDQVAALRKLVLRITWDGQDRPAVWCPLGDFFGTAPGENLYQSLPSGMTKDGYYAFWYMPFAKSAVIELLNEDDRSREVTFDLVHAPLTRPIEQFGRFHVKWHRGLAPVRKDRWPDWTVLQTEGRGRFCGFMLHVWVPRAGWWGEGDEKFFVDGEKHPSTFGTGSEDYFGYAWGTPQQFARPYHAQTLTRNNLGDVSVVRWQLVDSVPFQKSFEGSIEKYDHTGPETCYATTAYWYLSPNGSDPLEGVPVDKRLDYFGLLKQDIHGIKVKPVSR